MNLKIATWNVNSLKVRLSHVETWLKQKEIDILALQEIKLQNHDFPETFFNSLGYHCYFSGQKTYNGVAFLSKQPLELIQINIPDFEDPQQRLLAVYSPLYHTLFVCLYAPNGASLDSDKFIYKQQWYAACTTWLKKIATQYEHIILMGDFNIIPDDRDTYNAKIWDETHILSSQIERSLWQSLCQAANLVDSFRLFESETGHYSWWDYRQNQFQRQQGLRIDHILMTQNLVKFCQKVCIDRAPRAWERPSDHTPVMASLQYNLHHFM